MPIHRRLPSALRRYIHPSFTSPSLQISRVLLTLGCGPDLFWSYVSLYNTVMKVFFITSSLYILYLMKRPFRPTFDPNIDTFKIEFLVIGAFAAAMVFNYEYSFAEVHTPLPSPPPPTQPNPKKIRENRELITGALVIQYLARKRGYSASTIHYSEDR